MIRVTAFGLENSALPQIPRAWILSFWVWATENAEVEVLTVTLFIWRKSVRLRHLFPLFERIFGRNPVPASSGLASR